MQIPTKYDTTILLYTVCRPEPDHMTFVVSVAAVEGNQVDLRFIGYGHVGAEGRCHGVLDGIEDV